MNTATILWTGGKDSYLAMHAVRERMRVERLVTFTPDPPRPFLAHPVECMKAQAAALGIEHRAMPVGAPLEQSYERAIAELARKGTQVLVTGDMDRIEGHDNWIVERSKGLVEVERPLWQSDRIGVLRHLLESGLRVVCTLARKDAFDETIVGREFDEQLVAELEARHGVDGFDACGENGEYHTCVLDGPGFERGLELVEPRVQEADWFHHLVFDGVRPVGSS